MQKRPDIGTRKKLRLAMCVLYLVQIVVCTMPFIQDIKFNEDGLVTLASPFNMFLILFGVTSPLNSFIIQFSIVCIALIIIPVIAFFFCSFDKERNIKNIVSLISCVAGVALILIFVPAKYMSIGAVIAILLYVLIMFLTSVAMVMRLSKDVEIPDDKKEKEMKEKMR